MCRKICCLFAVIAAVLCLCVAIQATEDGASYMQLSEDIDGLTVGQDMLLDLNGHSVTNATVAEGVTLRLMDSANDQYESEKCGSFSGTVNGTVEQVVKTTAEEAGEIKSYLVVCQEGTYSAHRFYAGITGISLVPDQAALGYKAEYYADDVINEMVTGYGYQLWINSLNPVQRMKEGPIADQELTLRLKNILSDDEAVSTIGATAAIGGNAVIRFAVDGQTLTVTGADHSTTLRQAVEAVNTALGNDRSAYTAAQVQAVRDLYNSYTSYMTDWAVEHIFAEEKFAISLYEDAPAFLYRVGNSNTVALGSLFKAVDGAQVGNVTVTVAALDSGSNVSGVYTANSTDWTAGILKFTGTGPVELTITDDARAIPVSMKLEVVSGYNVTQYSELKNQNSVLLNDITMSEGGEYYLSNATLYGNGFTFDVIAGAYTGKANNVLGNYLVGMQNANLDNVQIIGAVYTTYGATAGADNNRAAVSTSGNCLIANSYISNCAAPVRVHNGNVEIINTTLKGGNYANLDIRNGNIVLDNVTTINQVNGTDLAEDGTKVVGLGVVFHNEQVLDTTTVEIRNGFAQYNTFSKTQADGAVPEGNPQSLVTAMFNNMYSDIQYQDASGETWIHSGILAMINTIDTDNVIGLAGYTEKEVTLMGQDGYVFTKIPTAEDTVAQPAAYETAGQYSIAPTWKFDYTTKNNLPKEEGSNDYCYYDNGVVMVSMDEGDSFAWDTSILTVTKNGQTLPYTVTMNGADYSGKEIAFNTAGDYTVTYTYTDSNNYCLDADGNLATYDKTYTKTVLVSVAVVKPDAKHAEFTFGSDNVAAKVVTVGNDTYVMPDVTATSTTIGSKTVNGTTIYCPIVDGYTSNGKTTQTSGTKWYMYFPVFKNAVTITDYADGGTGAAVTYDSTTTALPSGLTAVNPGSTFQYASAGAAPDAPTIADSVLVYTSPEMEGVNRDAYNIYAKYQYTDNAGSTYYYYVLYKTPKITNQACVTGDTLVTLADGSQKEIQYVTYADQLLVWDFYEGEYAVVPAAIIFDHGYDNNTVIKLTFSDGTSVKVVNLHQFMDATENQFVTVDAQSVAQYVGHEFVKRDGNGYQTVTLTEYAISQEYVEAYGIITAGHYNLMVNGMLSTDFMYEDYDLFNYFAMGENMMFDQEAMAADIAAYGLYTYEDFADYLTYEQFVGFNVQFFKISVGKGLYTYEGILNLIETYLNA